MYRLGINYDENGVLLPKEAFALFRALGFDAVFTAYLPSDPSFADRCAVCAAENGLAYESLHAPFGHINDIWKEGDDGDRMLRELTDAVEAAHRLQIPVTVVHLSSGNNAPCVNDVGHRRLDMLMEVAVKRGVTVAFENLRKLANLAFVMELYESVEKAAFCWDVGHEQCFTGGREYMPLFGKRLVCTHIHDNLMEPGGDLHMLPFDGKIRFERTVQLLKQYDYHGTLTLEVFPHFSKLYSTLSPEEFYRKAFDAAAKLREMAEKAP